jgi:hypothetical protein
MLHSRLLRLTSGLLVLVGLAALVAAAVHFRPLRAAAPSRVYLPFARSWSDMPGYPIVFVSRQIPDQGSIYYDPAKDMPGVGPHSRFRIAAPGRLLVWEPGGRIRTLIDGSRPSAASLNLIDVNAPDVSYDGTTILFAGLPQGNYSRDPRTNPGAWRIYRINVDGSGLRQLTFSDQPFNAAQFGPAAGGLSAYDDTDPAWLPDGRVVFSSTRWPSYAQYSGVRTSNLYVMNADGSGLHRITSERNGADRPLVDPVTGKIVYARWWRNHRFALNDMSTVADPRGGYVQKDGLSAERNREIDGSSRYNDWLWRNAWQAATINPDGTELALWSGTLRDEEANHIYGGAFTPDGQLIANFFPMFNMTEAGGFGGLRRYTRGPGRYTPILGATALSKEYVYCPSSNDCSFGIYRTIYATEPDVLPDGRIVFSRAPDTNQDYGLYIMDPDGTNIKKIYDNPGTTELRARIVRPRPRPPVIPDRVTQAPAALPPAAAPYTAGGTFVFDALNVFANAPVDTDIVSAPAVGSVATIRFFLDHQRTSPGSFPNLDWPILLGELAVSPAGAAREPNAPADLPLFEQLRAPDGTVPLTVGPQGPNGAAHVAGMNFGRPGTVVRCVGCHAGHTMIPVPANDADAKWTNLAPGAQVSVSSTRDANYNTGLIDRRVMKGEIWRYWTSAPGQQAGQWARLTFRVPITVRTVRLYNPRQGDEANSSIQVGQATVRLLDAAGNQIASRQSGPVSVAGTDVRFDDVPGVVSVQVTLDNVTGTFYGAKAASLAEIEVIGHG